MSTDEPKYIGQAEGVVIRRPFGRSYTLWKWKGRYAPRVMFPAATIIDGDLLDMQSGEVFQLSTQEDFTIH